MWGCLRGGAPGRGGSRCLFLRTGPACGPCPSVVTLKAAPGQKQELNTVTQPTPHAPSTRSKREGPGRSPPAAPRPRRRLPSEDEAGSRGQDARCLGPSGRPWPVTALGPSGPRGGSVPRTDAAPSTPLCPAGRHGRLRRTRLVDSPWHRRAAGTGSPAGQLWGRTRLGTGWPCRTGSGDEGALRGGSLWDVVVAESGEVARPVVRIEF